MHRVRRGQGPVTSEAAKQRRVCRLTRSVIFFFLRPFHGLVLVGKTKLPLLNSFYMPDTPYLLSQPFGRTPHARDYSLSQMRKTRAEREGHRRSCDISSKPPILQGPNAAHLALGGEERPWAAQALGLATQLPPSWAFSPKEEEVSSTQTTRKEV